jgi:hypothetical protein
MRVQAFWSLFKSWCGNGGEELMQRHALESEFGRKGEERERGGGG